MCAFEYTCSQKYFLYLFLVFSCVNWYFNMEPSMETREMRPSKVQISIDLIRLLVTEALNVQVCWLSKLLYVNIVYFACFV